MLTSIALILALAVGAGSYHIARLTIESRRLAAGEPRLSELIEDVAEENRHTLGYLISALLMAVGTTLTFQLVTPMGLEDYYALLIDGAILLLLAMGITLSWIDLEIHILPTKIIYFGGIPTLALLLGAAALVNGWTLLAPMILAGIVYFVFYCLIWFWRPGAFGFGDVRLSFFLGSALGFLSPEAAMVGFIAPWILAVIGILIAAPFGNITAKTQIAFGPWMILGAFVGLFWGRPIVDMLVH